MHSPSIEERMLNALAAQRNQALDVVAALTAHKQMMEAEVAALRQEVTQAKENHMKSYALLLACYKSGQIPEAAWQEHLKDMAFADWLRTQ